MGVEIGTLVVRGTFGVPDERRREAALAEAFARLRRELREEMREILDDAERRARER